MFVVHAHHMFLRTPQRHFYSYLKIHTPLHTGRDNISQHLTSPHRNITITQTIYLMRNTVKIYSRRNS